MPNRLTHEVRPPAPRRCLIADDDALMRMMLFAHLNQVGYEVITACDGEEALKLARQATPDVVVIDKQMPRLNGYEAASMMRASEALRRTPMILMSGAADPDEATQALQWGFQGFISKPFRMTELIDMIADVMGKPGRP